MKDLGGSLLIAVLFAPSAWAGGLGVELGTDRVTVTGLSLGGSAVVFGVAREPGTWTERVVCRSELVTDGDGDGWVELVLDTAVAWKSIWAVVDFGSGELRLATPEGYPLEEMAPETIASLFQGPSPQFRRLAAGPDTLQLLLVRPGEGAWSYVLSQGRVVAGEDLGEQVSLELGVGGGVPAREAGDVLVAIDPHRMTTYAIDGAD